MEYLCEFTRWQSCFYTIKSDQRKLAQTVRGAGYVLQTLYPQCFPNLQSKILAGLDLEMLGNFILIS